MKAILNILSNDGSISLRGRPSVLWGAIYGSTIFNKLQIINYKLVSSYNVHMTLQQTVAQLIAMKDDYAWGRITVQLKI